MNKFKDPEQALKYLVETYRCRAREEYRKAEEAKTRGEIYERAAMEAENALDDQFPRQATA